MNKLLTICILALSLSACHSVEDYPDDPVGNFDALWTIIDQHYCFLDQKHVDWDSVYSVYRPQVNEKTNYLELFYICSDMLNELRDGHVNLTSYFSTSYYKNWWSDYPQNFDQRLVEEHYFHFQEFSRNGLSYCMLPDSVGYIRYPQFTLATGDGTLDWALALLRNAKGLIIDIRDNGGGALSVAELFARRFISQRTLAGYICHKSGPGHSDFSEPYAFYYDPADAGRVTWLDKPVAILVNRSTYSAANQFVSFMRHLPNVIIVGDRTGGGSGMPFSSEMPNGWAVRFSASPIYDCQMQLTEAGIDPDIRVDLDPTAAATGHDTIIDTALATLLTTQ